MKQDLGIDVAESILCRGLNDELHLTLKKMTIQARVRRALVPPARRPALAASACACSTPA